ncbi:MAG: AIR synthase-related protein, partial [Dongiaceae bacterium]
DLEAERRNGDFMRELIESGRVTACHDLSDGGLLVALAEMAMAGNIGAALAQPDATGAALPGWLFGEDQARYVVTVRDAEADAVLTSAAAADVPARPIGKTGGDALTLADGPAISVARMKTAHEAWLPAYMASEARRQED